ncbi:MAG TPA: STAS domain-containing protein [Solirubrobacteraceae bacterium]|nr:STAS domain-containing protein [Solirubrobacteraceae bacterium]
MPFRITERTDADDARRLTLTGELDIATTPKLSQRLQELGATYRRVRLDLSQLDFMDSTGIAIILLNLRDAAQDGWELEIDPTVSPQVARLLSIAGIERQLWPSTGR